MNYIILTIVCMIVTIIFYFIGKGSKIIPISSEEILKQAIEAQKFHNALNPIVKDIYTLFVSKNGPKHFQEKFCHIMVNGGMNIEFWSANDYYNRKFISIPIKTLKYYNMTLEELNKSLSIADKKILDYIANAIITNNKEFLSRLFI